MKKYLSHNGNLLYRGENHFVYREYTPLIPDNTDFIYLANNFDGTKITNMAVDTTMGDYYKNGTLSLNGTGENCYLVQQSNGSGWLYTTLTQDQLDKMKAVNSVYTFYCRIEITTIYYDLNAVISWRAWHMGYPDGYNYMFRNSGNKLQFHADSGIDTPFVLNSSSVYKMEVDGTKNLVTIRSLTDSSLDVWTFSYSGNRTMNPYMHSIAEGYNLGNTGLRFYGIAGIQRATNSEEDEIIKNILLSQSV